MCACVVSSQGGDKYWYSLSFTLFFCALLVIYAPVNLPANQASVQVSPLTPVNAPCPCCLPSYVPATIWPCVRTVPMFLSVTPCAFVTVSAVVGVRVFLIQQLSLIWCSVHVFQDTTQNTRQNWKKHKNIISRVKPHHVSFGLFKSLGLFEPNMQVVCCRLGFPRRVIWLAFRLLLFCNLANCVALYA